MIDRIDSELASLRTAANLRAFRQELLASNIANADTPNYKARDIDFKAALGQALSGQGGNVALATTSPQHLGPVAGNAYGASVAYRREYQGAVDGNTVNMDVERAAFAENSVQLEAALTFLRERMRVVQLAIQGQ